MICHHYKCVFVHVPKCAGQSIEHVFLKLLDLGWDARAPLLLMSNSAPKLGPPRLAHLRASEYVQNKFMTQDQFDGYFKFGFVRNPWDRMVSFYRYFGCDREVDFRAFVLKEFHKDQWQGQQWFLRPQVDFLYDETGELLVDFVGRFENLQGDFNRVCERIGLPHTQLAHINKSNRRDVHRGAEFVNLLFKLKHIISPINLESFKSYRDYYDEEVRNEVTRIYKRDVDMLGYKFD